MIKTKEAGRSMVEMLGVLAVMGVLSITGVAAYTMAMNKHRANELLNAVSMRATALASQRMTGKALSLAGFTDNTQGTSVIDVNSSNAGAIEITISNVPLSVCKNMYNTRGANVIEMKSNNLPLTNANGCVDNAEIIVIFNNDLSAIKIDNNENTTNLCLGIVCNIEGSSCISGNCVCSGIDNREVCGTTCCSKNEVCNTTKDGIQSCDQLTNVCTSNNWCEENGHTGKFCKVSGSYASATGATISGGTCEVADGTSYTFTNNTKTTNDDKTFFVSSVKMSYWAAKNFCEKNNKKLISYNTLSSLFLCEKEKALDASTQSSACDWNKFLTENWKDGKNLNEIYWTEEHVDFAFSLLLRADTYHSLKNYKISKNDGFALCE